MSRTSGVVLFVLSVFAISCFFSCKQERIRTLQSPVQAVAALLRTADRMVKAELVLISTARRKHEFITAAENVLLRMPDGKTVALAHSEDGHYRANSSENPDLVYEAGQTYQFRFHLPEDADNVGVETGDFVAVTQTPADQAEFVWEKQPQFAGDTAKLAWKPRTLKAIVVVYDPEGEVCYSTFDFSDPQFRGDKWGRLGSGGKLTLGVDVFKVPGQYRIRRCR
jgi:hypothetical protein